jgi:hypothetical protein
MAGLYYGLYYERETGDERHQSYSREAEAMPQKDLRRDML